MIARRDEPAAGVDDLRTLGERRRAGADVVDLALAGNDRTSFMALTGCGQDRAVDDGDGRRRVVATGIGVVVRDDGAGLHGGREVRLGVVPILADVQTRLLP